MDTTSGSDAAKTAEATAQDSDKDTEEASKQIEKLIETVGINVYRTGQGMMDKLNRDLEASFQGR